MKREIVAFGAAVALTAGGCGEIPGAKVNNYQPSPARTWQIPDVCSAKDSSGAEVAIGSFPEIVGQRAPVASEDRYRRGVRTTGAYVYIVPDRLQGTPVVGVERTVAGEELSLRDRRIRVTLGSITITLSGKCENGWSQELPREQPGGSLTDYTHFYPPNMGRQLGVNELPS